MAQVSNPLITGLSGKFGDTLVFRTLRGKTFVSATPRKPDKRKESDAQRKTRSTFKEAAAWARHVLQDPVKKTYYQKRAKVLKLPNAYTAAVTEYMRKPKVVTMTEANRVVISVSKPGFAMTSVRVADWKGLATVVRKADCWLVIVPGSGASSGTIKLHLEDATGRTTEVPVQSSKHYPIISHNPERCGGQVGKERRFSPVRQPLRPSFVRRQCTSPRTRQKFDLE